MVDHSLESLFWIKKDDMLTKYRIEAQIKDKDAKSICYEFFKLFPKFETVYIIQGGRDVKKIRDFFHFLACFLWLPWERFFLIYLSLAENLASFNLQDGSTKW